MIVMLVLVGITLNLIHEVFMSLRMFSQEELNKVLQEHTKWLCNQTTGQRADLSYADLSYANLRYADLRSANLSYADLSSADLSSANLRSADLSSADLSSADLRYANLRYANLSYANLRYADLRSANLSYANLSYADLSYANVVYFTFNRHTAYFLFDSHIRIGCVYKKIEDCTPKFIETLGKSENYTDQETAVYASFIKACKKLQKEYNEKHKQTKEKL